MMRSHGIAPNAASIKPAPGSSSATSAPAASSRSKSSSGKKRKFSGEEENIDDDEDSSNQGASKTRLKKEVKGEMNAHANVKEEAYREDSPSAQLQEALQIGLGAGLCDINRELVGYYSGSNSSAGGGSINGDAGGLEYGDVEVFAAGSMNAGGMNATGTGMTSCCLRGYNQQQTTYGFDAGTYGMMGGQDVMTNGSRNVMSGHGGQDILTPRSHAASLGGMGMGGQQYQSMRQVYDNQGGSDSPLLVE